MATRPEIAATANPTPIASHSTPLCVSVNSFREPYSPAPEGDRCRQQEAEARGRLPVHPQGATRR